MRWPRIALVLALSLASVEAHAELDEALVGDRSYAMGGAHRALGTSNDTLFVNPAGMAITKRFSLDLQYGYTTLDERTRLGVSAVDSKSGPVAGGFGYVHVRDGEEREHHFLLGAAYPISDVLMLGATLRHVRAETEGEGDELLGERLFAGDVGVIARLGESLNVGVAYTNFTADDSLVLDAARLGFGLGANLADLTVTADMTMLFEEEHDETYHGGLEYLAANSFPLRLGYSARRYLEADGSRPYEHLASAGLGYLTPGGALEVAYRRSLSRADNQGFIAALKIFL